MNYVAIAIAIALLLACSTVQAATMIISPTNASRAEKLAARELQRYIYLRTGALVEIANKPAPQRIVVARKGQRVVVDKSVAESASHLKPQEYVIRTTLKGNSRTWWILGGDDTGVLYGTYRFVEQLGIRFYLHGDVIPDKRLDKLPVVNEAGKPIFPLRGIQPFHDFPEGPDWWNLDDYRAYISQLPKLRMNFIGFHCYPEWSPEPAVWIGDKSDVEPDGKVKFSYPARWANTALDGFWLYAAMPTSSYASGASLLFPGDAYGNDVMNGYLPAPKTVEESNQVFNNTADMFREVFSYARELGIKTCVGTETPLQVPAQVREHLKQQGKDASAKSVYEGMFTRIARAHPVDYYWLWTPEVWTHEGNTQEQVDATINDFHSALAALDAVGKPFTLASCGWVLGPVQDRAALDRNNLERHNRKMKRFLTKHDDLLAAALGTPLPQDLEVSTAYTGNPRIIVPTVRSQAGTGESIRLRVIILDNKQPSDAVLHWRPLGKGTYKALPIRHASRGVYEVLLPAARNAFEYYITAQTSTGKLVWPSTAPEISQTVVVW